MSLKVDRLELEIVINNDQSRKQLRDLNDEALNIQKSIKGMVKGSQEYIDASQRLDSVKKQMDSIYDSIGITGLSLNELRKKQQEFNMIVKNLPANSPEYAQYKKTLDEINGRISELSGKAKTIASETGGGGIMSQILGVAGGVGLAEMAIGALKKVASAVKDYVIEGIQSAIKLQDSEKELLDRLNGNRDIQKELIALAKERAGTSMYSRLEIEEQEKFLIDQGRTETQIKKTMNAAIDLAAHTGGTLKDAVEVLDGTMEGKLGKSLGKLDKGFRDLSKEQLYNGAAIDLIAKKYSDVASEQMDTMEGKLNLQEKAWIRLQRGIGDFIIGTGGMFDGLISGTTSLLNTMAKWFEIPISQKLEEEQNRVNYLASAITDANLTADARNKLYKELETLAPDVVAGLDKENISYENLTRNLAAYNDQMVNKIILSKQDEKIEDANATLAIARKKRIDQEVEMREFILSKIKGMQSLMNKYDEEGKIAAKKYIDDIQAIMYNPKTTTKVKLFQVEKKGMADYFGFMNQYKMDLETEQSAQAGVNVELNAKNQLIKDLGINITQVTAKVEENAIIETKALDYTKMTIEELNKIISAGAVIGASEKEKTEARAAQKELKNREKSINDLKKFNDDYNKIMEAAHDIDKMNFADKLSQTEQEIKSVNDKYNAEIKKIQEFLKEKDKVLKPDQKQELNTEITNLDITRQAQVNQVLEQAEKDFAEKVRQIHENLRVARMTIVNREVYEINKKYDDLQKEILDAIEYRYQQEVLAANGDTGKILVAEKNKADALAKVQDDMSDLAVARNEETNKAIKTGDQKFEEDLLNLKLKSDKDLATGKEKIQKDINLKYKKLLDDNIGDEKKTKEIKVQMEAEYNAEVLKLTEKTNIKKLEALVNYAKEGERSLSAIFSAQDSFENQSLKKDEDVNKKKKANLKSQLDNGKLSQKDYDAAIAKMDDDADAKKREVAHKQAVRQKELAIFNATIALLQAIIQAANIAPPADIIMPIIVAAIQGITLATLIATPVPAASEGRYDVIGQKDGKVYKNVPYTGKPKTGIYENPTLVSENGREIIIDNPTTENLIMNYPDVIRAINYAHTGVVPQHAEGYYPTSGTMRPLETKIINSSDPRHTAALEKFNKLIEDGITANVIFDDYRRALKKVDTIESLASKTGK